MPKPSKRLKGTEVFLNLPYEESYEPVLLGLTGSLVALKCIPRLTFEEADDGVGRMRRIFRLLKECPVSLHDLSIVADEPRLNMPFELGLACAIREMGGKHRYFILESKRHRLGKVLSDLAGWDPKIHNGRLQGAVTVVLEMLRSPGSAINAAEVIRLCKAMQKALPAIFARHKKKSLFNASVYGDLVSYGWAKADEMGLH